MPRPDFAEDYLTLIAERLQAEGFELKAEDPHGTRAFDLVARRRRIEAAKLGVADTTMVFQSFPQIDFDVLRAFSSAAFELAAGMASGGPPRGLGKAVICYAVAIAPEVDAVTTAGVRGQAPVKHWSANEIPVVVDLGSNRLHYFEKTPLWGAAYYRGFRRTIEKLLAP